MSRRPLSVGGFEYPSDSPDRYYCYGYDTGMGYTTYIEPGIAHSQEIKDAWAAGLEDGKADREFYESQVND